MYVVDPKGKKGKNELGKKELEMSPAISDSPIATACRVVSYRINREMLAEAQSGWARQQATGFYIPT